MMHSADNKFFFKQKPIGCIPHPPHPSPTSCKHKTHITVQHTKHITTLGSHTGISPWDAHLVSSLMSLWSVLHHCFIWQSSPGQLTMMKLFLLIFTNLRRRNCVIFIFSQVNKCIRMYGFSTFWSWAWQPSLLSIQLKNTAPVIITDFTGPFQEGCRVFCLPKSGQKGIFRETHWYSCPGTRSHQYQKPLKMLKSID